MFIFALLSEFVPEYDSIDGYSFVCGGGHDAKFFIARNRSQCVYLYNKKYNSDNMMFIQDWTKCRTKCLASTYLPAGELDWEEAEKMGLEFPDFEEEVVV